MKNDLLKQVWKTHKEKNNNFLFGITSRQYIQT